MEEPVTGTLSDVLTSPIAIARPDGTGEMLVDGVSHPVRATSVDAARQDCSGYVFHEVVQNLGRAVRVEARDSEATADRIGRGLHLLRATGANTPLNQCLHVRGRGCGPPPKITGII